MSALGRQLSQSMDEGAPGKQKKAAQRGLAGRMGAPRMEDY